MVKLKKEYNYIKTYNNVANDLKFMSKSKIRLIILNSLIENPKSPKDLTIETGLKYSSISRALHQLKTHDFVYRDDEKYFIANSLKFLIPNLFELSDLIKFLNEISNILDNHDVYCLPEYSVKDIHLLYDAGLIESDEMSPIKIYDYIFNALNVAKSVKCILPFYNQEILDKLNLISSEDGFVDIKVDASDFRIYQRRSKTKRVSQFKNSNNFLLVITNQVMILGFYKLDGTFDQNRLIYSGSENSLKWANNLFRFF